MRRETSGLHWAGPLHRITLFTLFLLMFNLRFMKNINILVFSECSRQRPSGTMSRQDFARIPNILQNSLHNAFVLFSTGTFVKSTNSF